MKRTLAHFRLAILGAALVAGLAAGARPAHAATAYYASAQDVYARSKPGSYAMGRLYTNERMDIQYIDSNGWAYGYMYGSVSRCVWAQYSAGGTTNFWTHGTAVSDKCRTTNKYLETSEFSTGEIWTNAAGNDGVMITLPRATETWDNWLWNGGAWGAARYRGTSPAGSVWKIRYTTRDGAGVMARPCYRDAAGALSCVSDWYFIQRSSF